LHSEYKIAIGNELSQSEVIIGSGPGVGLGIELSDYTNKSLIPQASSSGDWSRVEVILISNGFCVWSIKKSTYSICSGQFVFQPQVCPPNDCHNSYTSLTN